MSQTIVKKLSGITKPQTSSPHLQKPIILPSIRHFDIEPMVASTLQNF